MQAAVEQVQSQIMELNAALGDTTNQLKVTDANIMVMEAERRRQEVTIREINAEHNTNTIMYKPVGRMYIQMDHGALTEDIHASIARTTEELETEKNKQTVLRERQKEVQSNMEDIAKSLRLERIQNQDIKIEQFIKENMRDLHTRRVLPWEVIRYEHRVLFILSCVSSRLKNAISSDPAFIHYFLEENYSTSLRRLPFSQCYAKLRSWIQVPAKLPFLMPGTRICMFYDIPSGEFLKGFDVSEMPLVFGTPKQSLTASIWVDDQRLFLCGGFDGISYYNDSVIVNINDQSFETMPSMSNGRGKHGISRIKDCFYVFGGFNDNELDKNESLNLDAHEWQEMPDLPHTLTDVSVAALEHYIFVVGKWDTMFRYNTIKQTFKSYQSQYYDGSRMRVVANPQQQKIYVFVDQSRLLTCSKSFDEVDYST